MYHSIQDFMFKNNIWVGHQINPPSIVGSYDAHIWANRQEALCGAWNYHMLQANAGNICPICSEKIHAEYIQSITPYAVNSLTKIMDILRSGNELAAPFLHFRSGTQITEINQWISETADIDIVSVVMPWL